MILLHLIIISTICSIMQALHSQRETRSLFSILLTTQYLSDLKWNGFTKKQNTIKPNHTILDDDDDASVYANSLPTRCKFLTWYSFP